MLKKRSEGKKMRNLLILGAGGHGHVVAETARAMQDSEGNPIYDKIDFLDDLKAEAIGKPRICHCLKKNIRKLFRRSARMENEWSCIPERNVLALMYRYWYIRKLM